jgi:DNA-binding NtrC family response regulator
MGNSKKYSNKILVIDDDKQVLETIMKLLKSANYKCIGATSRAQGLDMIKKEDPLVILTDLKMETGTAGIDLLEAARDIDPNAVVILYTGYGTVPNAVEAFKKGAFDFIQKVKVHHDILLPIERAVKFARIQRENTYLRNTLDFSGDNGFYGAVGASSNMKTLFDRTKRVSQTDATILITGETGTGKEVLARGIHYYSPRKNNTFVPVAVGTLPDHLLEAELFGHVRGSFTGANTDKEGLVEAADKGTIFLDEIGEVNFDTQHKLLRVLQEKTVRRVGSVKERVIDVRFVSATNEDPEELVKKNKMREDLFYRLNVIQLNIPPLRERKEDIPILAYHFLKLYKSSGLVEVEEIDNDVMMMFHEHDWPGNVRELQALIQQLIALATKPVIKVEDLPEKYRPSSKKVFVNADTELDFKEAKSRIIDEFEKNYIEKLLKKYKGNITKVADAAGLNRKTIYRLMEARDITFERNRNSDD